MKNGLIINGYGTKCYFLNDMLHREDGPAIEFSNGTKYWYINGERHREDGPAVIFSNGDKWYYLDNRKYSEQEYLKEIEKRKSLGYIFLNLEKELSK